VELKLEKVTRDTIKFKGYEPWFSVTYMTTDENKQHCIEWVRGLIRKGIIKPERDSYEYSNSSLV
jgi:hypothetical protein